MFEKICIILLVNILFFAKTITYKYCSDDIPSSQRQETHPQWKRWLLVLEGHLKSNTQMDHFITTVLHALVCVFIYLAFRKFPVVQADNIAFLASFLFSFNPINNQGSVWISGRGYVLSALGMTMALTFPAMGIIFILLATYSNAGFLAPIVLLGSPYPWLFLMAIPCWAWWGKNFKKNVVNKMAQEMYTDDKRIHPSKLILAIKTFGFYLTHSLFPVKTTFYHSYMQSMAGSGKKRAYNINDRFFWIGVAAALSILAYWIMVPWNMVSFGLLWFCVCIAPFSNLMRMSQEIAERYVYLPNVGLMIVLASVLINYPLLAAAWVSMYATKLWFWMDAYSDDYYLVEHSCMHSPDAWFAWHIKAMRRWDQKSYQEAVIFWTMARMISPNEFKILFNIATALKLSNHVKEANDFLKLAESNIPSGQEQLANKLITDWRAGNYAVLL